MSIRINVKQSVCSIVAIGFLVGCTSTTPPPLPPANPADPQVRVPAKPPTNFLAQDDTTVAIQKELSQTESTAKSAETMQHEGMQHGSMQGMQHEGMNMEGGEQKEHTGEMEGHEGMQHGAAAQPNKKAVADEMKKTADKMKETADAMKQKSDEMKQTSEAMKQKSAPTNPQGSYYTCRMHPQIHSDEPGKCPICGMTLIKKKGTPPK